jgi:hypothetical protein
MNLMHGWYSLVVTQPSTSHQLVCVQVCVRMQLLCRVFIIVAHLGNEVIFYQLSPLTLLVTVNSCIVTQSLFSTDSVDSRKLISEKSPELGCEPKTTSVAGECFNHSATVNR